MGNIVQQNPYESPSQETLPRHKKVVPLFWSSRFVFLLTAFLAAISAFYCGLALIAYQTPFLDPDIGIPMLASYFGWAFGFSGVCTVLIGLVSLATRQVKTWHYALLLITFVIEFSISRYFFAAFFSN